MTDFSTTRPHDPSDHIYWRDEILQLMFWYRGEGFGEHLGPSELRRFLLIGREDLSCHLKQMVEEGYLRCDPEAAENRYMFTPMGEQEARRRFLEEFEPLRKPGHYECNNPDCECHDPDFLGVCKNLQGSA